VVSLSDQATNTEFLHWRLNELNKVYDTFRAVVYNGRPVKAQRKVGSQIRWRDYDGNVEFVSERAWLDNTREVFVPKKLGTREHVLRNWGQYCKYCNT
jgi:hypothetical protein